MASKTKCIHILVGSSKSGKSFLLRHIVSGMLERGILKFGIVFSSTAFNRSYDWLPKDKVYSNFDIETLWAYLNWLISLRNKGREIPSNFIILDDIVSSIPQGSKAWKLFLSTARHFCTLFVTTQHINQVQPLFREQCDYAYLFRLHTKKSNEAAYQSYGQLFETVGQWRAFVEKHTATPYQCLVYSKESRPIVAERYSTYKAPAKLRDVKFLY